MKNEFKAGIIILIILAIAALAINAGVSGWIVGFVLMVLVCTFFVWALCVMAGER